MVKYSRDRDTKYYVENICHQFPDLGIICIDEFIVVIFCINNLIKLFKNQISLWLHFEVCCHCHLLLLAVSCCD